jgi:NADPH:quinone reductase-like Zn-dependent oxidoreductase
MPAVAFSRLGGPEFLEVLELPAPRPGPGEVRIRVAAATGRSEACTTRRPAASTG